MVFSTIYFLIAVRIIQVYCVNTKLEDIELLCLLTFFFYKNQLYNICIIFYRIVRNKAAEKAKHAHQQQQAQQQGQQQQGQPGTGGSVSVIAHAPATPSGHPAVTAPNAYSISGILGIPPHHQDPNGNSIKRKRTDDGKFIFIISCTVFIIQY